MEWMEIWVANWNDDIPSNVWHAQEPDNYIPHAYVTYTEVEGAAPMANGIIRIIVY